MANRFFTMPGTGPAAKLNANVIVPGIVVEVFGANGYFGPNQTYNINANLVSVTTSKDITQPAGTAVVTLTGGVSGASASYSWLDLLEVMDFILIRISKGDGSIERTVFAGYITDINEVFDVSQAQAMRSIKLNCADLLMGLSVPRLNIPPQGLAIPGNEFGEPAVTQWLAQYRLLLQATAGTTTSTTPTSWLAQYLESTYSEAQTVSLDPTQLIYQIIASLSGVLFSPITQFQGPSISGLARYQDLLNVVMCDTSDFAWQALQLAPYDTSIWSICTSSMLNVPYFEMFADLRSEDQVTDLSVPNPPGVGSLSGSVTAGVGNVTAAPTEVPYLPYQSPTFGSDNARFFVCLRRTPFDPGDWAVLTQYGTQVLDARDILSGSLGKSRSNVINLYQAYPEGINQSQAGVSARVYPGLADPDSIVKYGLSFQAFPLYGMVNPNASSPDDPSAANFQPSEVSPYETRAFSWYWYNAKFLQGSVTIKGDPSYRVGQRLSIPSWPLEAYIESVSHSYTLFGSYQTTLTFSRGCRPGAQYPAGNAAPLALQTGTSSDS